MTPRVWADYTFLGLAEDVLVVLTLREEESGAKRQLQSQRKDPRNPSQDHHQLSGSEGSEEDGVCGRWWLSGTGADGCNETGETRGNFLFFLDKRNEGALKQGRSNALKVDDTTLHVQRACGEGAPVGAEGAENLGGVD